MVNVPRQNADIVKLCVCPQVCVSKKLKFIMFLSGVSDPDVSVSLRETFRVVYTNKKVKKSKYTVL